MNHPLREYTRQVFANLIAPGAISRNAEISTLNWAVQATRRINEDASWENPKFRKMYKTKVHWLMTELRRPNHVVSLVTEVDGDHVRVQINLVNQLAHRLKTKELDVKNLAKYPADVLWPDGPMAKTAFKIKERDNIREQTKAQMDEDYVGQFKCGKCKSVKTHYYQMQTRSADEPMVRFLVLLYALFVATNSFYRQLTSRA
jgi:transcription elongation factor S-II